MNPKPYTVMCMKWGTKFGAHYVNRLASMVRRHLSLPHRFVCFTDNRGGIDDSILCYPMPDFNNTECSNWINGSPERGWRKLLSFEAGLFDELGSVLFLDLDVIIVGSLNPFFEYPGEFLIAKDSGYLCKTVGNSSVYRFETGAHPDLLSQFIENRAVITKQFRNEQEYICKELEREKKLQFWPKEWCVSFKYHCIYPFPLNWILPPKIPKSAKIIIFHGHPKPEEAAIGSVKKFLRPCLPTPWITPYWQ